MLNALPMTSYESCKEWSQISSTPGAVSWSVVQHLLWHYFVTTLTLLFSQCMIWLDKD